MTEMHKSTGYLKKALALLTCTCYILCATQHILLPQVNKYRNKCELLPICYAEHNQLTGLLKRLLQFV